MNKIIEIINEVRYDLLYMMNEIYEMNGEYPKYIIVNHDYKVKLNGIDHLTPNIFKLFMD